MLLTYGRGNRSTLLALATPKIEQSFREHGISLVQTLYLKNCAMFCSSRNQLNYIDSFQ